MFIGPQNKKEINFDLNLIPVFDILSACICFLLITAVWIQIGSIDATQALGGQEAGKPNPSVMVYLNPNGQVQFLLKDVKVASRLDKVVLKGSGNVVSWPAVNSYVTALQAQLPSIKTALIMPSANVAYEDMVRMMDMFRNHGMSDIGISPL